MRSPAMVVAKRNGIARFAKYPADFSGRFAVCVDGLRVDDKKALFLAFSFLRLRFAAAPWDFGDTVAACRVFADVAGNVPTMRDGGLKPILRYL